MIQKIGNTLLWFLPVYCLYVSGMANMVRQVEERNTLWMAVLDNGLFIIGLGMYFHVLKKSGLL